MQPFLGKEVAQMGQVARGFPSPGNGNGIVGGNKETMAVPRSHVAAYGEVQNDDVATVGEEIRREIARELHDRVTQTLTTMLIELENFKVEQTGRQSVLRQVDVLQQSTRGALNNLRTVLYELRGEDGVEVGLIDSLRTLLVRFEEGTQVAAQLSVTPSWPRRLRSVAALNIYRIIEEALTNVRLHSGARLVEVALSAMAGTLAVEVRDDGIGAVHDGRTRKPGLGVIGMRERALLIGGRLEVVKAEGGGTIVRAVLPQEEVI
jgi:signal transduction histidine kinase